MAFKFEGPPCKFFDRPIHLNPPKNHLNAGEPLYYEHYHLGELSKNSRFVLSKNYSLSLIQICLLINYMCQDTVKDFADIHQTVTKTHKHITV